MTAKKRAEEIIVRFLALTPNTHLSYHKQCATIVLDEIIKLIKELEFGYDRDFSIEIRWQEEIKQELQSL